jgi:superfamily I DNA/RNA helicase
MEIVTAADGKVHMADGPAQRSALEEAIATARFDGNALQRRAQAQTVERLDPGYLLEELNGVIEGRALPDLAAYLATSRAGRRLPLNATQREAIWRVYEAYGRALAKRGLRTWEGLRRRAAELIAEGRGPAPYDGAIVDEAQDLAPTVLRLLLGLCAAPDRLFVTADANQSIYGAGFRWTDVHADLRFQGRTGVLRTNHRTTREIGEAARTYLRGAALDPEDDQPAYGQSGPAPVARAVPTPYDETQLLARFVGEATRAFRLGVGACAVLVPTEQAGKAIAARLKDAGVAAAYMTGRELDLERRAAKIVTLKSAKGLEFPIVALAGFGDGPYPGLPKSGEPEELAEALERERRTLYVAMTRAMRALLVALPVKPAGSAAPLFAGFDPALWNHGQAPSAAAHGDAAR